MRKYSGNALRGKDYLTATLYFCTSGNSIWQGIFVTAELNERSGSLFVLVNSLFDYYFPLGLNYQNSIANGTFVPLHIREFYLDFQPISRLTLSQIVNVR